MTRYNISPAARTNRLLLPDNRTIHWYEWGPITGKPLIFCTGAGMSGSLGFGEKTLERLNIRLIAPDRPGLGFSSQHPAKSLVSFADDVAEILKYLRLQNHDLPKCMVLGFSQGAVFAIALAKRLNVTGLAIVSGQDQFSYPATQKLLQQELFNLIKQRNETPEQFKQWICDNITSGWLLGFILATSSEVDLECYSQPDFLSAYRQCLSEGLSQGAEGYAQDLLITFGQWPVSPEEISCPVHLWYGKLDASTVHSPDFGATLSRRFPAAEYFLLEKEGGSLLWSRADSILEKLAQAYAEEKK
ncbi:MAG: alpha/beta hydrolase [Enterobacteriaceae bacterium]|jgi:pimeloyl-ACP methyl ester carboxylesterase|nr:alpha/beta hydrolase [Enterobacteriaceae bacterium]